MFKIKTNYYSFWKSDFKFVCYVQNG